MTIRLNDVVNQVREIVQDTVAEYRWSDEELAGFVNQALNRIAVLRPDLFAFILDISDSLDHTRSEQTLPDNCYRLIEIHYATGGDGQRKAIKEINRDILNRGSPNWYGKSPGVPREYMRNPRNSRQYFLSPPPADGVSVVAEYSVSPAVYALGDTVDHLPDGYFTVVVDATVFTLESSDDSSVNEGRAKLFYTSFTDALATGLQARKATDTKSGGVEDTAESTDGPS